MFCTSCGHQLKEGQKFCPKCGTKTRTETHDRLEQELKAKEEAARKAETERLAAEEEKKREEIKRLEEERARAESERRQEEIKRLEEERAKAEAERKRKEEEQKREEAARRKKEEAERRERERKLPLPDSILLEIRTYLLEGGGLTQSQIDEIYRKARKEGIADERTLYNLEQEVARFGNKNKPAVDTEVPAKTKKKHKGRKWLGWLIFILLLALLSGAAYFFRVEILNQFDSWGFQTDAMREWVKIPRETEEESNMPDLDLQEVEDETNSETGWVSLSSTDTMETESRLQGEDEPLVNNKSSDSQNGSIPTPKESSNVQKIEPESQVRKTQKREERPTVKVYRVVDEMPKYPGGGKGLQRFIERNLSYPLKARQKNISGEVLVKFVVTPSGAVSSVSVAKSSHPLLDEAAKEVVSSIKGFTPGYKDGIPVHVEMRQVVRFRL